MPGVKMHVLRAQPFPRLTQPSWLEVHHISSVTDIGIIDVRLRFLHRLFQPEEGVV
jgi:hypothetical protein